MAEESLKYKTKKGLYWSFLSQVSNYGLQFAVGIVMARLLSPEDYGITALPAVFMAVAGLFQTAGIGSALIRKKDLNEEDLSTAFIYSISIGILLYLFFFFSAPYIADFYKTPILTPLLRVTTLTFLWGPLSTPQNVILNRRLDFKTPTRISIVTRIISAIVGLILAFTGFGLWALVANGIVASLLGLILTWHAVRWLPKSGWSRHSFNYLFGYGSKIFFTNLIDKLYNNISPMFIGKYYSPADLGVYNRALGYANMPSQNIMGTLDSVTFPVLSKMADDTEKLHINYRKIIRTSAFVVFPIMMLLAALSRPLIIGLITDKWEACILYLQLMCFWLMLSPIHGLNFQLLLVRGRTDLTLKTEILKKIICFSIMAITLPIGIIYFVIGSIASSLICLAINTYYTGKIINVGFFIQVRDILPSFVLSLAMGLSVFLLVDFIPNVYLQIIIGGLTGVSFYLCCSYLFHFQELEYIKYLVQVKK